MWLEHFTIIVDDYDRAIEFFTGALGFELAEDSPALDYRRRAPQEMGGRPAARRADRRAPRPGGRTAPGRRRR